MATRGSTRTAGVPSPEAIAWRNSIFVVFALAGIALASWVSRLPAVRDAIELSPAQVGALIFGMAAGSIVGLSASSLIIARIGAKSTMLWGTLVAAAGVAIAGTGGSFSSFAVAFAGLFVFGAALGITDVAMNVSGAANERVLGRSIMPVFHAFFSFGTMVGAGLGALAEAAGLPIVIHLGAIGAVMVVAVLIASRHIQPEASTEASGESTDSAAEAPTGWRARFSLWRNSGTLLIGVIVLAAAFAEGSANDWIAIAMVDGHGVDNATGALVFGIFVTAMTAGRLVGVFLLDRFGRVVVLRGSFLLASVGLVIVIFVPNPYIAMAGTVLWGLGSALGFPVGMSAAADDPKTAAARVSAVAIIGYFAFLVGPPVIGLLGEHFGVLRALLVVLVLCAIGIFVSGAAREPAPRTPAPVDTFLDPHAS